MSLFNVVWITSGSDWNPMRPHSEVFLQLLRECFLFIAEAKRAGAAAALTAQAVFSASRSLCSQA
jgi:hypothetical protein